MRAVVTGMIGTYGVGGVVWDYGQYLLGLERLGFDVYYLEDTGQQAFDPVRGCYSSDYTYAAEFLSRELPRLSPSLTSHWHLRAMDGTTFGLSQPSMVEVVAEADLFLNVSGAAVVRPEYLPSRRKILIDTDPGWNHFHNYRLWDAAAEPWLGSAGWRAHDTYFTYAEGLGRPECLLPDLGVQWHRTRPPVVLRSWSRQGVHNAAWTTVMTWNNFAEPIRDGDRTYGTKEREFGRIAALPGSVPATLEVAVGGVRPPVELWKSLGWKVVDSLGVSRSADQYRDYIERSRGELSVAKNVYVATRSGWFSCRSACYLAAGLPVVVQDTGFSQWLPCGEGLLVFDDLGSARSALEHVESSYDEHCATAAELAATHFSSDTVLTALLEKTGL
ncbi:MAG: hypothetical protein NVS3B26_20290 [Mycobacteriales bacterium]